ncbi:cytochrome c [Yoonia sp. 208BN28-4]|uniref:cytochrome c n=1 Tax=Yoonia sp. 208BN28-4 TaxID=3126505 RepID=UPI0030A21313
MTYRALLFPLILAACSLETEVPDGRAAFAANCAGCHGADAMGRGTITRDTGIITPDLTTLAKRNGGTFPRTYVMATIDGLDRGAHFSNAMPEFGAGDLGEAVIVEMDGLGTPVPLVLLALTDYLESIQQD